MKACLRETQIEVYHKLVDQGFNLIYLVSDSVSTSKLKPFLTTHPDRVVNVGIAEQNLMGIAAGLANGGYIPITGNATPFTISRSNEQLKVDISYSNSNVKVNGLHAGFSYGTDGCTHHEVTDISVIRGFPNFEIYVPCDPRECAQITEYAITKRVGPVYISLNTGNFPNITTEDYVFEPGKPVLHNEGDDLTIVALGTAIHDAIEAQHMLHSKLNADIFSVSSIRPLNLSAIKKSIEKTGKVLTIEQHSTHGGIGSIISEFVAEQGLGARVKRLGVPEGMYTKNWVALDNKVYFGLDAQGIVENINTF